MSASVIQEGTSTSIDVKLADVEHGAPGSRPNPCIPLDLLPKPYRAILQTKAKAERIRKSSHRRIFCALMLSS